MGQLHGIPSFEFFKMEAPNLTRIESAKKAVEFLKRVAKYQCFYNEIEIEDETVLTGRVSPFFEILSLASNVSPTIIRYTRSDGYRKMLICLPPYLDMTTVAKKYGTLISKAHRDFYQKDFKGRPESKNMVTERMREIWESELKGTKHPISRQCEILSKRLNEKYNIQLEVNTIRRHYLKLIRERN